MKRTGVMLVGLGGNNGTTFTGGVIANRCSMEWETKEGSKQANFHGSLTQASTIRVGKYASGVEGYVPFSSVLPMLNPTDIVIGGWDINNLPLGDAMRRAGVFDHTLQNMLYKQLQTITPLPGIFRPSFIAANQASRANNILSGSMEDQKEIIRGDIRRFKSMHNLDLVIVMWTGNTERFSETRQGLNTTPEELLASIRDGHSEISPSQIYAVAAILEGSPYINGSPQNTFVPGVVALAQREGVFIGGDDFKSGQTKLKSVLVDFLVSAGIKPESIVSYNHLGNNDGMNLQAPQQFRSKEISKTNVIDDVVSSNEILYPEGDGPDHTVVIKYVPFVRDTKRAMDEYISSIFMNGRNTLILHNTCEDSLLAAPLMVDLLVMTELCSRVKYRYKNEESESARTFHNVLSVLSYFLKAPLVPSGAPVINSLSRQREYILNIIRACAGIPHIPDIFLDETTCVPRAHL